MRRYRLTQTTYRGQAGWLIGGGSSVFPCRIFFEHESAARRTIARLRADADYEITLRDYEP